jgi:hypothetical protein
MNARPAPASFAPISSDLRMAIMDAIEALILVLDELDGDPDIEPGSDDDLEHDGREPEAWE